MKVVEFLGIPGSGKTTLAALTVELPGVVSLDEAVRSGIARSGEDPVARTVAKLSRSAEGRVWGAAYARATDRFAGLARFIHSHPETLTTVTTIQQSRAERDLHPEITLGWILNLMARYQIATESGGEGHLVIDEGFAQRGVALLAGGFTEPDLDHAPDYVGVIPRPDLLVVVDTPVEACLRRLDERGWSERLVNADDDTRTRFLEATDGLVNRIAAEVEAAGTEVIWVSGTTSPPNSVDRIAATLTP